MLAKALELILPKAVELKSAICTVVKLPTCNELKEAMVAEDSALS